MKLLATVLIIAIFSFSTTAILNTRVTAQITSTDQNLNNTLVDDITKLILSSIQTKLQQNKTAVTTPVKTTNNSGGLLLGCKDGIVIFKGAGLSLGCVTNPFNYTAFNSHTLITHNDVSTSGTDNGGQTPMHTKCKLDHGGHPLKSCKNVGKGAGSKRSNFG